MRNKYDVVPLISILCVFITFVNVFLMAKILSSEIHLRGRGGTTTAKNDDARLRSVNLEHSEASRARPRQPQNAKETTPADARPPKKERGAIAKPSPDGSSRGRGSSSRTSPHLVDCRKLAGNAKTREGEETGMFMPIHFDGAGSRPLHFVMNIHDPLKDDVSYKIFKEGCFECDHLTKLLDALSRHPDSYLLDVGGNIGMWSLVAAAAGHTTYTIEPYVENYERICKSVDKNSFHDRVHVINVAATSQNTSLRIDLAKRNFGGGRVAAVTEADAIDEEYLIKGVPIDSLNLPTDRPVILKLDVEGHELQALTGGINFLQHANIVYAMTELRPTFQSDAEAYASWKGIMGALAAKGLVPYRVDYEEETRLDVNRLHDWRHVKHPAVRYFDVVWRKGDD